MRSYWQSAFLVASLVAAAMLARAFWSWTEISLAIQQWPIKLLDLASAVMIVLILMNWLSGQKAESLRSNSQKLNARIENLLSDKIIGEWQMHLRTGRFDWSANMRDLFDLPPADSAEATSSFRKMIFAPDLPFFERTLLLAQNTNESQFRLEHRVVDSKGVLRWVENRGRILFDSDGSPITVEGVITLIDDRKKIEGALEKQTERMRIIFETAPMFIRVLDANGLLLFANHADGGNVHTGILRETSIFDFLPNESQAAFRDYVGQALHRDSPVVFDLQGFGYSGSIEWYAHRLTRFREDGQTRLLLISSNISARKAAEMNLAQLAHEDPLTRLPNRYAITKLVRESIEREIPFGLLCIDLDHFKTINDTLGHDIGDLLLMHIAKGLKRIIGRDNVLARLGGDEFLGLVLQQPGETAGAVRSRIERIAIGIMAQAAKPRLIHNSELFLTASVGISIYPQDGGGTTEILKFADLAMYHAKSRGRANFVFFEERFSRDLNERFLIHRMLRVAIERRELRLNYQPLVDVKDGKIRAAEALLRWSPANGKSISPGIFIPISEDTGLIHSIGEWVMNKACEDLKDWKTNFGTVPRIAINISARQFERVDFAARTLAILHQHGLCAEDIELELTETSLLSTNSGTMMPELIQLAEAGVKLVIDDFGTGYSSLSYLKKLPVQSIKLDRSFVAEIGKDINDEAIVRAVVAMAYSLGLAVVAEGVEIEAQLDFLTQLGCDTVQGFFYGEALGADDFAGRWRELFA